MPFTKEYREKHREEINEYHRKYYLKNKLKLQQKHREWIETHKEEKRLMDKKYADSHKKQKCEYDKQYRIKYKSKKDILNKQTLRFKGTTLHLSHNPRIGECSDCHRTISSGQIKVTNMHHVKYDPNNPLAHTIELCVRCHNIRHH